MASRYARLEGSDADPSQGGGKRSGSLRSLLGKKKAAFRYTPKKKAPPAEEGQGAGGEALKSPDKAPKDHTEHSSPIPQEKPKTNGAGFQASPRKPGDAKHLVHELTQQMAELKEKLRRALEDNETHRNKCRDLQTELDVERKTREQEKNFRVTLESLLQQSKQKISELQSAEDDIKHKYELERRVSGCWHQYYEHAMSSSGKSAYKNVNKLLMLQVAVWLFVVFMLGARVAYRNNFIE
mmetsp:Transcript_2828/g.3160  ORF Transcript_2828/g.3160 Transcript_2828/m.3160 type:complete len:239 (-) Transcript_2828:185-901(-)